MDTNMNMHNTNINNNNNVSPQNATMQMVV